MVSKKTDQTPQIDKDKIDSKWTLMVNFRQRVSKKKREQIAAEKNCTVLSSIKIGSADRARRAVEKGRKDLKDVAHHTMCCVLVPQDGRKRKTILTETIEYFKSYEKEIFDVRPNVTISLVKPVSEKDS